MQITNSLNLPTLSTADSPNQLSDENPPAKSVKKKGQAEKSSFDSSMDGALMALISGAQPTPAAQSNADLISKLGEQAATKVELSTKKAAAQTDAGAPAPTIASLFQAKAQQNANGTMADAFVAGPDRPWGSRWVFGGNQPSSEDLNAAQSPTGGLEGMSKLENLKKFVAQAKAQAMGGDESQLKLAGEAAGTDLAALQELVKQYGGEIVSVSSDSQDKPAKAASGLVSGGDFLSVVAAGKAEVAPAGGSQASMPGSNESGGDAPFMGARSTNAVKGKASATSARPDLQVIPGGLSGEGASGRLEGGLRSSKDETKPSNYETVFMAPANAQHLGDSKVALPPQTVMGHVVPGAMMKERLTSESLKNVANGIQGMGPAGGGEMRIKMNPGNLGELMIRVTTNGKDVGLKVQATDSNAKKILEESLGSLRDSLAQQSLSLGRVDVIVAANAPAESANSGTGQQGTPSHDMAQQHSQQMSDGQSNASQGGRQWGNEDSSSNGSRVAAPVAAAIWARGGNAARAADSRLDVMA